MSISAHKFHGPKGIGILYINKNITKINKISYGGEQENNLRPGTENVSNIVGLTLALEECYKNRSQKNKKLLKQKKYIITMLQKYSKIELLSPNDKYCLPNTILLIFKKIKGLYNQ